MILDARRCAVLKQDANDLDFVAQHRPMQGSLAVGVLVVWVLALFKQPDDALQVALVSQLRQGCLGPTRLRSS